MSKSMTKSNEPFFLSLLSNGFNSSNNQVLITEWLQRMTKYTGSFTFHYCQGKGKFNLVMFFNIWFITFLNPIFPIWSKLTPLLFLVQCHFWEREFYGLSNMETLFWDTLQVDRLNIAKWICYVLSVLSNLFVWTEEFEVLSSKTVLAISSHFTND